MANFKERKGILGTAAVADNLESLRWLSAHPHVVSAPFFHLYDGRAGERNVLQICYGPDKGVSRRISSACGILIYIHGLTV